jgi:hypothetical protein
MKSISLKINSVEVKSETRALKTQWTRELATDISHFSGIDTDYFERVLAKEMRKESRKKSIDKIFKN